MSQYQLEEQRLQGIISGLTKEMNNSKDERHIFYLKEKVEAAKIRLKSWQASNAAFPNTLGDRPGLTKVEYVTAMLCAARFSGYSWHALELTPAQLIAEQILIAKEILKQCDPFNSG